jgi:hypothetical protein
MIGLLPKNTDLINNLQPGEKRGCLRDKVTRKCNTIVQVQCVFFLAFIIKYKSYLYDQLKM